MSVYARQLYLESKVLQAEPLQLIRMLYQAAIEAVTSAREHLRAGRIDERSRQISRAMEILAELHHALDLERGGNLAANLLRLYDYMQRRLWAANAQQIEPPLKEVERLLATLREAWDQCALPVPGPADPPPVPGTFVLADLPASVLTD